jgi:hypothetical protein
VKCSNIQKNPQKSILQFLTQKKRTSGNSRFKLQRMLGMDPDWLVNLSTTAHDGLLLDTSFDLRGNSVSTTEP